MYYMEQALDTKMRVLKECIAAVFLMTLLFIGALAFLWVAAIRHCETMWNEPPDDYKPKYKPEPDYYERKKRMDSLMNWQMYKSDRFMVKGNIMYQVRITDFNEQVIYHINFCHMITFRKYWDKLDNKNRDSFLMAFTIKKEGEPVKQVA